MSDPPPEGQKDGKLLDGSFWFLLVVALVSATTGIAIKGTAILPEAARIFVEDLVLIVPQIVLGITVGSLFTLLISKEVIARHLGEGSGLRGIALAGFFGSVMPGGPFTSFPIVYALGRSGAGIGSLISFLVAWAAVGLNRIIIWELPFMGPSFTALHVAASLPLPILAGVLANRLSEEFPALRLRWDR